MGYDFDTVDSHIDEDMITASSPCEFVRKAAEAKASGALALCGDGHIIIAADTVVELAGCVLGKPKDEQDARRMLSELSGSQHTVHTGLCVLSGNERVYSGTSSTRVTFRKIGNKELDLYIASGEPLDKAGAVGVQERGAIFCRARGRRLLRRCGASGLHAVCGFDRARQVPKLRQLLILPRATCPLAAMCGVFGACRQSLSYPADVMELFCLHFSPVLQPAGSRSTQAGRNIFRNPASAINVAHIILGSAA